MLWLLLTLIFTRPFISSLAFPCLNLIHSACLATVLFISVIKKRGPLDAIKPIKIPFLVFILSLSVSWLFSHDKTTSIKELYKYATGLLLVLAGISLPYKDKSKVISSIVMAGFIISLLAIYQYLFGFRHVLSYIAKHDISNAFAIDYINRKRVFFPFITPNILAGYLIMVMPLALIHKNRAWFIVPMSFALLLTKSLGALLSVFLALCLYFCTQSKFPKRRLVFLFMLLVTIGAVFTIRAANPKGHLQPIFSIITKFDYWKDTLKIIKTSPLAGVGLGNFNLSHSRYAHNSYLQAWAEMGILGLIGWIWIIISAFKAGSQKLRLPGKQGRITIALIYASGMFLIHNLVDFSFFLPEAALIWWVILGLLLSKEAPDSGIN